MSIKFSDMSNRQPVQHVIYIKSVLTNTFEGSKSRYLQRYVVTDQIGSLQPSLLPGDAGVDFLIAFI